MKDNESFHQYHRQYHKECCLWYHRRMREHQSHMLRWFWIMVGLVVAGILSRAVWN